MPAFKGCQADGRFIDCEECRWAQFRIREWLDDRGECHDEEVIVCSKPKEARAHGIKKKEMDGVWRAKSGKRKTG